MTSDDFDGWVRPHRHHMIRLAAALTSPSDAEDVVQDALVRAWRRRSTYDATRGEVRTWLLALTADRARRWKRGQFTRTGPADLLEWTADEANGQSVERDLDLRDAIRKLPDRQRQVVILTYYIGLSGEQVSVVLNCALGTVKSTLHDARRNLGIHLEEEF
jgi:RNA polymerase sigma factor (sigma-70 family)